MSAIQVRKARRSDSKQFLRLLRALADFEKLNAPDKAAERRILADVFDKHRLGLFVAARETKLLGYALYYYSYSSFLARPTLYLEDIFVLKTNRGKGIGTRLFGRCVREAILEECGRMEWAVLTWNDSAIKFYENIGARRLNEWYVYRLNEMALKKLKSFGP
jgi:GNAT superfamily N-acetyltransferase